jgi:hypothetical protein
MILPVVFYGCETSFLTLREEHRLGVFENRVLRGIFGLTGEWRKLHNEELRDLFFSRNIIRIMMSRRIRWTEYVAQKGKMGNAYKLLVEKANGKRTARNTKMYVGG